MLYRFTIILVIVFIVVYFLLRRIHVARFWNIRLYFSVLFHYVLVNFFYFIHLLCSRVIKQFLSTIFPLHNVFDFFLFLLLPFSFFLFLILRFLQLLFFFFFLFLLFLFLLLFLFFFFFFLE